VAVKTGDAVLIGFEGKLRYFHKHCAEELKMKTIFRNLRKLNRRKTPRKPTKAPLPRFMHSVSAAHEPDEDTKETILQRVIDSIVYHGPLPVRRIAELEGIDKSSVRYAVWSNSSHTNKKPLNEIFKVVGYGKKGVQIYGLAKVVPLEGKTDDEKNKASLETTN